MITTADTIHDALRGKNIIYRPVSLGERNFKDYAEFCRRDDKFYYNHTFMRIPMRLFAKDEGNPTGKVYAEICDLYYRHFPMRHATEDIALEFAYIEYENTTKPQHDFLQIT